MGEGNSTKVFLASELVRNYSAFPPITELGTGSELFVALPIIFRMPRSVIGQSVVKLPIVIPLRRAARNTQDRFATLASSRCFSGRTITSMSMFRSWQISATITQSVFM